MDYDFRNRAGSSYPMYGPTPTTSSAASSGPHSMYGSPLYPRIGQQGHNMVPPVSRTSSYNQSSPPSSSSSGLGIRVALKPEYRITPPPPLSPQVGDIPWSNFHFDFDFEKRVLAEAEKGSQNWSRLGMENHPPPKSESTSSSGSVGDPVANRYIASGLNREAVQIAVANYGDNPTKVREFVNGYNVLREMGFTSNNVAEVLLMHDNDTDKALAHLLSSSN
ncbi:Proline-rich cell wall protein-like [Melia azedarach]|uniref:Proline-rich cell wall protein-like n=1 Tax=Melia azedarach TaxID=155640 RepID=A0ACC1X4M8_MELAZ|nr:Proline-rich cell wall protein-like [Melia azedarach]